MAKVAPSILAADFSRLQEVLAETERAGADLLHLDIMDGHFVPNLTFGPLIVQAIRKLTRLPLDAHLMILEPSRYIPEFIQAGADTVTIHVEAEDHILETLQQIRAYGSQSGISLNPPTAVEVLLPYLPHVDRVLVMSVHPGFAGQTFIPETLAKVEFLAQYREREGLHYEIAIDGGINAETGRKAVEAGADILVAGSFVYQGPIAERIQTLKRL